MPLRPLLPLRPDRPLGLAPGSVSDHRELARSYLPRGLFDYIDGGANEEHTLRANRADLASIRLRQRVLRDVSSIDLSTEVLGRRLAMPVVLAPVGLAGMFATRAEVQAARAAHDAGIAFTESTVSICSVEEVAAASRSPLWYQLYVMRDRHYAAGLMRRAAAVGCEVLVLTVDLAVPGLRYRDVRNGLLGELGAWGKVRTGMDLVGHPRWVRDVGLGGKPLTFGNLEDAVPGASSPDDFKSWVDEQFDPSVTWDDLAWVREHWDGKLILKGILDVEDAERAADAGVEGIVVSNHGGRQLDDAPSTISVLGAVVDAVGDRLEVLMDGGVRGGLDVVKALACGARAVMVGRPWAWAVAGGGEQGVRRVLRTFEAEMRVAMALTGVTSVRELSPESLMPTAP
jgi:L-lactate dehydrogenase (cytochrome)